MVGDARAAGVDVGAAEVFSGNDLAGRGFHQRRTAEEDGALLADDDGLVRHGRNVRAAGSARAHHGGDLRDAARAHVSLIVEDAAEVFAVGEDFRLVWQVRASGVDQVDARQAVLDGDFLRAEVFLHGDREIGPALHRGVVADDDAFAAGDPANAGDDASGGGFAVIHAVRGKRGQLQEG